MRYKTNQEEFWANEFGNEYMIRNEGEKLISSNVALFSNIIKNCPSVTSIAELGCNIGLNLTALNRINKNIRLRGYEINENAANKAKELGFAEILNTTIVDQLESTIKFDLAFTKGVLIHIDPKVLENVYQNLYGLSNRYIMVCEYYSPLPESIDYRGYKDRLFKRDFAGELLDKFNLKLVNYGFNYQHDHHLTNDDSTWFLLEKIN